MQTGVNKIFTKYIEYFLNLACIKSLSKLSEEQLVRMRLKLP